MNATPAQRRELLARHARDCAVLDRLNAPLVCEDCNSSDHVCDCNADVLDVVEHIEEECTCSARGRRGSGNPMGASGRLVEEAWR